MVIHFGDMTEGAGVLPARQSEREANLRSANPNFHSPEGIVFYMSPTRMSRWESAIRLVIGFNEAFNRHDVAGMMHLMSEDCLFENTDPAPDGSIYLGKAEVTRYWQVFFHDSPHAHIEIEEIFSLGLRCIMRWRYEWVDLAGNKGHVRGVDIYQVKDDLISQKLSYVKG